MARRRRGDVLDPPVEEPVDVPVELAAVPQVRLPAQPTRFDRRRQVRELFSTKRSESLSSRIDGLVASAQVMDPTAVNAPSPNAVTRTWQHAAAGYKNTVGELNAGCMYVGNALSRCSLAVGKRNPDGSVEQGFSGDEPVEDLDNPVALEAADLISKVQAKRGGQSELLRSSGEKLFIAGELYYVPEDTPSGMMFDILSTQELLRDGNTWTKYLGPGYGAQPLPPGVNPIRVWRPDGQWSMLATSSVRSCLEILEELLVLTRLVRASAISRMSLAGMLLIPDELDTPDDEVGPDGGMAEATNPLAVDMTNTGAKAIDDPASAAAWMPYIIQGPADYLDRIRHVAFEASNQEQVIQRTEALQRLAQGLDLPVEVILGHMSTTFANAQQISIDTFRIHLEPTLQLISDALTIAYLWPAMAKSRGIDPESIAQGAPYPDDILSVAVTYDASNLISAPDRVKELVEVYLKDPTQQSIRISEVRDALNQNPDEVVEPEEVAARVDAIRLTKIRETIAAPPSDSAVGIESINEAVVPGQSAGAQAIEELGTEESRTPGSSSIEASGALTYMLSGAVSVTTARAIERVGAKLRAKLSPEERSTWSAVPSAGLPMTAGYATVRRILASDVEATIATEIQTLTAQATQWLRESEHPTPDAHAARIGEMASIVIEEHLHSGVPVHVTPQMVQAVLDIVLDLVPA